MLWSILIAGIPERYHSAHGLLHSLLEQQSVSRMQDVELLYVMDNRRRSVGEKRNDLLEMAHGEYLSFIDDDDEVASDFVQKIYRQIVKTRKHKNDVIAVDGEVTDLLAHSGQADVICFPQRATLQPAGVIHECSYSLSHWKDREPDKRRTLAQTEKQNTLAWTGPPAHTMVWRAKIAKSAKFPEKNFGEDVSWVDAVCEKANTEIVLNGEPMYFYKFDQSKTETR